MQKQAPPKAKAAPSKEKLAQEILALITQIAQSLENENELLKNKNLAEIEGLRKDKMRLVHDYEIAMQVAQSTDGLLKEIPATLKQSLRDWNARMMEAGKKNALMLRGAIIGTQGLLETVMKAARQKTRLMDSYSDPRSRNRQVSAYGPKVLPVAIVRQA